MEKYEVKYPVAFQTVDIAIMRTENLKTKVLLIQKVSSTEEEKNLWRFPGGFVEPKKHKSKEQAASQEVNEETQMSIHPDLLYIGSSVIDDPRWRDTPHGVVTTLFEAKWKSGEAGEGPFDDAARTKWFDLDELNASNMNPIHAPLFAMLFHRNKMEMKANEIFKSMEDTFDKFGENMSKTLNEVEEGLGKVFNKVEEIFTDKKGK